MKNFIRIISISSFLAIVIFALILFFDGDEKKEVPATETGQKIQVEQAKEAELIIKEQIPKTQASEDSPRDVLLDVPFVLQAPFGNWNDPIFEDACEEAAILMADGWLDQKSFTSQKAYDEIKRIVELEKKEIKEHVDASAEDVLKILKAYSSSSNAWIKKDISPEDLVGEISRGNLVIVPTNGRKLANPNYTAPGPITHMIVIIGYDSVKKEFITNDSGTRKGKGYRYEEDVLFAAIRDYPTGSHYKKPINESDPKKVMIIVKR